MYDASLFQNTSKIWLFSFLYHQAWSILSAKCTSSAWSLLWLRPWFLPLSFAIDFQQDFLLSFSPFLIVRWYFQKVNQIRISRLLVIWPKLGNSSSFTGNTDPPTSQHSSFLKQRWGKTQPFLTIQSWLKMLNCSSEALSSPPKHPCDHCH